MHNKRAHFHTKEKKMGILACNYPVEINLFSTFFFQTRCMVRDNYSSLNLDHRPETIKVIKRLWSMELSEEANSRPTTMQHCQQVCIAI